MKPLPAAALVVLGLGLLTAPLSHAQIYSARRLTERIAPQPAPAQPNRQRAPASTATPGPVRIVAPGTAPPSKSLRPMQPEDEAPAALGNAQPASQSGEIAEVPLVVNCPAVHPDPSDPLQSISLCFSNRVAKAVSRATIRMLYLGKNGEKLKDWTTRRDFEPALPAQGSADISQPAFFMPFVTKNVQIVVLGVRFADGSDWPPK